MGIAAFGTLIKRGDGGSPESFTTIAEVVNITGPTMKVKTVDVTNHTSPGAVQQDVVTTIDPGTIKLTINWIPDNATQSYAAGLLKDMMGRTARNFQLIFPNVAATTWLLPCYVTGFDNKAPVEGKLEADIELNIYAQPTLA